MNLANAASSDQQWSSPSESTGGSFALPSTPLIGRTTELDEIVERLSDPATRLVTISGPRGVGKTRLALATLDRLAGNFDGRLAFISLVSLTEPDLIPNTIAWALSGREPGSVPRWKRSSACLATNRHCSHSTISST
jgi:hypothetical protein